MKYSTMIFSMFALAAMTVSTWLPASALDKNSEPYTYVLVHGAGGGGWAWKSIDRLLSTNGHTVYRPTLTGLGERVHLVNPNIDLTTHITDIVNLVVFEDLHDVVLVGHSYGGMVITGVMDVIPERISHAIFLDAAVPENGMAGVDIWKTILTKNRIENGLIHFPWIDETTPYPRDVPHPVKTFTEPASFKNPTAVQIPTTYIAYIHPGKTAQERAQDPSWKRAVERNWTIRTLNSDHNAHLSHPDKLTELLEIAPTDTNSN